MGLKKTLNVAGIDVAHPADIASKRGSFQVVTNDKDGKGNTETGPLVWCGRGNPTDPGR